MKVHLVTGGARSGKSSFVLQEIERLYPEGQVVFIATSQVIDEELSLRVEKHRLERGPRYLTIEEPVALDQALAEACTHQPVAIIIDCLTVWMGNLFYHEKNLDQAVQTLLAALQKPGPPVLIVTNEVGLGIVPDNAMARSYRDALGRVNQHIASTADRVSLLVCGLPVVVK